MREQKKEGILHKVMVDDIVFKALARIRRREDLKDRHAAIYWLLRECREIPEE